MGLEPVVRWRCSALRMIPASLVRDSWLGERFRKVQELCIAAGPQSTDKFIDSHCMYSELSSLNSNPRHLTMD